MESPTPVAEPDFRLLFEAVPACCLVLQPDLTIVGVNDAYLHATMRTREQLLGRALFAAFPDNPADPTATGVRNLRSSLERVLRDRRADTMPVQKYDIARPESEGGGFEERYWSHINSPVFGPNGETRYIIHHVEDVTARVRLEQRGSEHDKEIRELTLKGEERLRQILDAAPDAMIVVDADARIRFANAQTDRVFGHRPEELIGRSLNTLIPERLHSSHAVHVARYFQAPTMRAMGSGLELVGLRKDGREVPIEVSLSPLRLDGEFGVSAAIRDISERRRLEAAARIMAARLGSAVESIQDAFALFDENDRMLLCNSVYRRMLPSVPGAVVGRRYDDVLAAWSDELEFADEAERAAFQETRRQQRHQERAEFNVRTRDGRSLRVTQRRTPEGGVVETIWDLTEDARLAAELSEARVVAEAASAAKSEFLSSMSHELRTPLNAILGFSQLMQQDRQSPLQERHRLRVEHILKGGEHLLRLIDDILDLARIETGYVAITVDAVDVSAALERVRTTLMPAASGAALSLQVQVPPDLPSVAADPTRFAQILINFGSNAIKYNRPGGKVTFVASRRDAGQVRVSVCDTGHGIAAERQAVLFQPFQRAGQETGPIEGTGIGLVITKRLAELMGGRVGFRSVPGEGSEFWVDMPVYSAQAAPPVSVEPPAPTPQRWNARSRSTVLYIEDNPANVSFMQDFVETFSDLELVVAQNAEQGIELSRALRPRVVIADINLPGMSGYDALKALRAMPETADIPVIALTAAATDRDRKRGEQAGFFRYLTKPIEVEELAAALDELTA